MNFKTILHLIQGADADQSQYRCFDSRCQEGEPLADWLVVYSRNDERNPSRDINYEVFERELPQHESVLFRSGFHDWIEYLLIPPGGDEQLIAEQLHERIQERGCLDGNRLRTCCRCHEEFDREDERAVDGEWCSQDCAERTCRACGSDVPVLHGLEGSYGNYCSEECLHEHEGAPDED